VNKSPGMMPQTKETFFTQQCGQPWVPSYSTNLYPNPRTIGVLQSVARAAVKCADDTCFHHANQKVLMDHLGRRLRDRTTHDLTNAVHLPNLNSRRGGILGLWSMSRHR
jgi:hypothetical protein